MTVPSLYFARYIHGSTALYISYSLFMVVLPLNFVRYIHDYMKSSHGNNIVKIFYKPPNILNRMIFFIIQFFSPPVFETMRTSRWPVYRDGYENKSKQVKK